MDVREYQRPAWPEHPGQLGDGRAEVGTMGKGQAADGSTKALGSQRQGLQIASADRGDWDPSEHFESSIDRNDLVPQRSQVGRMPARPACGVQYPALRDATQQSLDDKLLDLNHGIAGPVVGLSPGSVSREDVSLGNLERLQRRLHEGTKVVDALRDFGVSHHGPSTEKR